MFSSVGFEDCGVIDWIDPEGAREVLGEASVGCVGLHQLEGDCLTDRRFAGGGNLRDLPGGCLGGHDLFSLAASGDPPALCLRPPPRVRFSEAGQGWPGNP